MGCIGSNIEAIQLYSLLNEITKESIRNAIAEDDLPTLASLEAETNYPTTIELSEVGLLWTSLHFCCRFDSPRCLEYFLRKCYLVDPNQYLRFVNHQTVEGNSCLHLCAIWNANRCFALLVKFGGLNIDLKNKTEKGILSTARDYERKKMVKAIKALRFIYGEVVPWNFQFLQQPINYDKVLEPSFVDNIIKEIIQKKEAMKAEEKSRVRETSKQERELKQMKIKVEKEREDMYQKRLAFLKEKVVKTAQTKQNNEEVTEKTDEGLQSEGFEEEEMLKEELELEKEYHIKEEELANIKKAINLLQMQEVFKKIEAEQRRVAKERKIDKKVFNNFMEEKARLIQMNGNNSENIRKSHKPEEQSSLSISSRALALSYLITSKADSMLGISEQAFCPTPPELSHLQELPLEIQQRYLKAQKEGSFIDKEFPHKPQSLGGLDYQIKIKPFLDSMVWLRPDSFLGKGYKLFDGIHPNDAKQGLLGVCYCLATISTLAYDPEEIKLIFPFHDVSLGFYVLRFYTGGKPNYVVVDDFFPCNASSFQPLFSKPIGREVWVLLIEKAWAKLIGSYYAAELMTPDQFMEDLTGYPTTGAHFSKKKEPLKDILECSGRGYPIVLTSSSRRMEGIVSNHAYSLLRVHQLEEGRIYRLRNPWGRFQWNGRFGEQSELWTPDLKIKCDWVEGDDGIFFLSEAELLEVFQYYSIGFQEQNFKYSFIPLTSGHREDIYLSFTHKGGNLSMRFSQPFKRMVQDKEYSYSGLLFEVGRIEGNQVIFLSEGSDKCFLGDKSVYASNQVLAQYPAGQYFVRLRVEWLSEKSYNSGVFSVYCSEKVEIKILAEEQGQGLWLKLLASFAKTRPLCKLNQDVRYSMNWMRGQMVCYAELRPESQDQGLKVRWQFDESQLKNCKLRLKKIEGQALEYVVGRDGDLGVVDRLSIQKSCSSGKISIKSIKLQ